MCPAHGASAPQVKAAAKRRLDQAADVLVQKLLRFALDDDAPDNIALAAIRDALDRAGLIAPKTIDVAIAPQPWEQIFDDIVGGSRAESRRRRGMPVDELNEWHTRALVGGGDAAPVVDPELVEPEAERTDLSPKLNAELSSRAGRKTYTLSDFER